MSTKGRSSAYYAAKVRLAMLEAASNAVEAALECVDPMEDSGAAFRIRELLERTKDETAMAFNAAELAAKNL